MSARRWSCVPLAALLLLVACGGGEGSNGDPAARAVSVRTAVVATEDVTRELESIGRLVSISAPTLASEINARVVEILADEGQAVERGQVLVRLDTTAFRLARAEASAAIEELEIRIANEERRVKRYRDLKNTNAMSQEGLDDAEAKLAGSRAAKAAAEARLAIAEDRLSKTELNSPLAGVIERRFVSVGDYVNPGAPMMSVTDTLALRAELPFPETVGHLLQAGQDVALECLLAPGLTVHARIGRIRPQVGGVNRALVAIVELENPGDWRPGGSVRARVVTDSRPEALIVPVNALVERPAGKVVYRYDARSDTVHEQVVEPGRRQNGWIEILSGVEDGMTVVSEGASYLSDGATVVVRGEAS